MRWFETIEELRQAPLAFQRTYNEHWLIERHSHRPPAAIREEQTVNDKEAAQAQFCVSKPWTGAGARESGRAPSSPGGTIVKTAL